MIYYVDSVNGNNENSGFDVSAPLKDLSNFFYKGPDEQPILHYGDTIAIKKGSVLYGSQLLFTGYGYRDDTIRPYITITSYGTGDKPKLSLAKIITNPNAYTKVRENVWSIDLSANTYISGYLGTDSYACNVAYLYDDRTDILYGERKYNQSELSKKGDFYVDGSTLYMFFVKNPYNYITKVIGNHSNDCLFIPINNMIIEGLCFTECGSHGVKSNMDSGFSNIIIRNNDFINLGGSHWSGETRLGNGVEIYGSAHDWEVCNNNFINIFDTATTCQGNNSVYENISFRNNYMDRCNNAFEIWCDAGADSDTGYKNVAFSNNIVSKSGKGFGGIGRENTSVILLLGNHQLKDITFKDNVIMASKYNIFNTLSEKYLFVNNKIIASDSNKLFGDNSTYNHENIDTLEHNYENFMGNSAAYVKNDTDAERMVSLELINNSMSDVSIKNNGVTDIYKHEMGIDSWIPAQGGELSVNACGVSGNMYFYDITFTPSTNIDAWNTAIINRDSRIRPSNEIIIKADNGTMLKVFRGILGSNSATYIQPFETLVAGTTYNLKGFYNIY